MRAPKGKKRRGPAPGQRPPTRATDSYSSLPMEPPPLGPIKRLLGVNLDGWLMAHASPDHYQSFITDAALRQLTSWRLPHVRLPLELELLGTTAGWHTLDVALSRCLRQ